MNHKEILQKYMGNRVDSDWSYWYQCVDWIRVYSAMRGRDIPNRWDAVVLWTKWLWPKWKRVLPSKINYPSEGDVVVWDKSFGGWYGHIAIANAFCNPLVLRTTDQNAKTGNWSGLGWDSISPYFRSYKWVMCWYKYIG